MPTLSFITPQRLFEHFVIPPDTTPWQHEYARLMQGQTPCRERATFATISNALTPTSELARSLGLGTGVYLLAFDFPKPTLYVGIAASGNNPEGILSRLRKHRIKATGSHVGLTPHVNGGVHHPTNWRTFGIERHQYFKGQPDQLRDARFSIGQVNNGDHRKPTLQMYEATIINNDQPFLRNICNMLWPNIPAENVFLLTAHVVDTGLSTGHDIQLWRP